MIQSLIYSNKSQECERAKMLLDNLNENVKEFVLDEDFTQQQFQQEFGLNAEYPQIAIGLDHRGTLKETLNYLKDKGVIE